MIREHCVRPGAQIVADRPFIYLPESLRVQIKEKIDSLVECCITVPFRRIPCADDPECQCWQRQIPAGHANGILGIQLDASMPVGQGASSEVLRVQGSVRVVQVGVITGTQDTEQTAGGCPARCQDEVIAGHMSLVLEGSLSISSGLWVHWNEIAFGAALLFYVLGRDFQVFVDDYISTPPTGEFFTYTLGGNRARQVYDLGYFRLAPE